MNAQEQRDIALVLSSGGARGLAQIGAIEELEAHGYRIGSIAGTSMGALVGGVYAAGKMSELRQMMKSMGKWKMLSLVDFSFSFNHIVKGDKVVDALKSLLSDIKIENLSIPFCAISTDWERGEEVVFRQGSLIDAIRASISLPALFNPMQAGGRILIDGGVINPLPLNRVERHDGDILVAVDVSGHDYWGQRQVQKRTEARRRRNMMLDKLTPSNTDVNYLSLLTRASSLMIRQNSLLMEQLVPPDILIDIQMSRYDGMDYDKSEKIIEVGRQKTRKTLEGKH